MCNTCNLTFDAAHAEAFAGRLVDVVNNAGIALMTSIGHRTGLFDAMSQLPPATSNEIAFAAQLNERYVREWLGAMVTAGFVEYDPEGQSYTLPPAHAAHLTRAAGGDNIAQTLQWIAVLGGVEDRIVDCFKQGGGVPYDAYKRFHDVMADESAMTTVGGLTDHILPIVNDLTHELGRGIDVLDIGCGKGRAMSALARTYPSSNFFGYDLCEEAIESGRAEASDLTNLTLRTEDVAKLPDEDRFDLITAFDAIHDQASPDVVLANIYRALKPGGVFLMQDIAGSSHVENNIDAPLAPFVYTISCMHCMSVSLEQGGMGLGAAWGEEKAIEMLEEAGFELVSKQQLDHDILNTYFVARKPE